MDCYDDQTPACEVQAVEDTYNGGSILAVQSNSTTKATSFSRPHWDYDVFLSFRGEDTRKNFTDHLYSALKRVGIHTFRDEEELRRGTTISMELLNVIRTSKTSIVVFSKDYASSRWCLDELVEIVHCTETMGHTLFPIFYNVGPANVRRQAGSFAEAFEQHEREFHTELVQRWRQALTKAGNISGWDLQNLANGYESRFIEKIVEEVSYILKPDELKVAKHVVGINSRVEEVVNLLGLKMNDFRKVGIYGLGGIGKTTLAKAVFNQVHYGFEGSSCLLNIKQNSEQPQGLVCLQKQLLCDILKIKNLEIANVDYGTILIEKRIYGKKLLIVLDDVDDPKQLDQLLGSFKRFGPGSRVIATTRDKSILSNLGVHDKYEVKELEEKESLQLFNLNAFSTVYPKQEFKELSFELVKYCGGLPLALEVLGSSLNGQSVVHWKMEVEKLQRTPHPKIQDVLRISFDSLDEIAKRIFLDISCFFIGEDKDYVIKILDDCHCSPEVGINTLVQRSLLRINRKKLNMHDLIRDMGRGIVQEESFHYPEERSRLWFHKDILNVLHDHMGTEKVEGIVSNSSVFKDVHFQTKAFTNMKRLRYLQINGVHLKGSFEYLSKKLRFLSWHKCPLTFLPQNFHLENLVILDLKHSNIQEVWKNNKKLSKLKVLNLKGCKYLKKSPDFSQVPQLEILILEGCISLVQVHESIGDLGRLVLLNLRGCENLCNFSNIISNLKSLKILNFSGCLKLKRVFKDLGNMIALKELLIVDTDVEQLPSSVILLKNLEILDFSRWHGGKFLNPMLVKPFSYFAFCPIEIPAFGMSPLSSWMSPKGSKSISSLLASVSGLHFLKRLNLIGHNLSEDEFPDDFGSLCSLEELHLAVNNFCILPHCISRLPNLWDLNFDYCTSLQSILGFPASIRRVSGRGCTSLERILNMPSLEHVALHFDNCPKLTEIQGLERFQGSLHISCDRYNNPPFDFWSQPQCLLNLGDDQYRRIRFIGYDFGLPKLFNGLPNWFSHQRNGGNSISFDVPLISEVENFRLLLSVVYKGVGLGVSHRNNSFIIRNESRGREHIYYLKSSILVTYHDQAVHLYQTRPISNVLEIESGDKIEVSIRLHECVEIKKWGIHVLAVEPNQNEEHETIAADGGSDASASQGHNPPKYEPGSSHSLEED